MRVRDAAPHRGSPVCLDGMSGLGAPFGFGATASVKASALLELPILRFGVASERTRVIGQMTDETPAKQRSPPTSAQTSMCFEFSVAASSVHRLSSSGRESCPV